MSTVSRTSAALGAAALVAGGYEHWTLYRNGYRAIPVIGVLFALNAAVSAAVALAVLARRAVVVRVAGCAVAATTLGFFVASRLPGGIFNFQETGLDPAPHAAIALAAELGTLALLGLSLVLDLRLRSTARRRTTTVTPATH